MKIIAEFCQNHNGNIDTLKEMIKEAAHAGATHAKIQTMFANDLTFRDRFEKGQESILRPYGDEYARIINLELDWDTHKLFIKECKKNSLIPITSVFVRKYIPKLKTIGFKDIKIASYDCMSYPMIEDAVNSFDNIFVSTGATYYEELENTVKILYNHKPYTLLHCITNYPTPIEYLNLCKILYLRKYATSVGYSDHTINLDACIVSMVVGVDVIEKHFTILPKDKTKDGIISMNPEELKQLVEFSKYSPEEIKNYAKIKYPNKLYTMMGNNKPCMELEEARNRDYYRGRFAEKTKYGYIYNWEK